MCDKRFQVKTRMMILLQGLSFSQNVIILLFLAMDVIVQLTDIKALFSVMLLSNIAKIHRIASAL